MRKDDPVSGKKFIRKRIISLTLIMAFFILQFSMGIQAYAGPAKDKKDADTLAEGYKNTAEALMKEIQEVNNRIVETSGRIESLSLSIAQLDKDIEEADKEVFETEDALVAERNALGETLQLIYESSVGDNSMAMVVFTDNMEDYLNRGEYVRAVSAYSDSKMQSIRLLLKEKTAKSEELQNLKVERQAELEKYENVQGELNEEINELRTLVKDAEEKAEKAEELSNELAKKVAELEAYERQVLGGRSYTGDMSGVNFSGNGSTYYYVDPYPYTESQLYLLAGIIQCEAGGYSYPGMIAVGSVIMNRVTSPNFANTIEGVIYAKNQFEPAGNGRLAAVLAQGPVEACHQAAKEVLEGKRNVPNYYFKADWYAEAHGIPGVNIGGNVFH